MYKILSCGSNGNYQLGIGNDVDQNQLKYCQFAQNTNSFTDELYTKPIKISCGGNHTLILFDNNKVFSCGSNEFGQCGICQHKFIPQFTEIPGLYKDVSCGWEYSILIDLQNNVYSCGQGFKGELGVGKETTSCNLTKIMKLNKHNGFIKVKSCMNHTIIQTDANEFYGFGMARKGQLGTTKDKILYTPTRLYFENSNSHDSIKDFQLGRDFTILISDDGQFNIYGNFQYDTNSIKASAVNEIQCMWSSIHIRKNPLTHQVHSFGNNSHGQLYPINDTLKCINSFKVGSEHGLITFNNDDHKLYSWGWGEHGNCGIQNKSEKDVTFDYLNLLYNLNHPIILFQGGCATTFIVIEITE